MFLRKHIDALRRIVQVNVMLVGKDDLDQAQSVFRPGFFPHCQLAGTELLEHTIADEAGSDHLAGRSGHLHAVVNDVTAILFNIRNDFVAENPGRYIPKRAKDQVADTVLEDWSLEIVASPTLTFMASPTRPSRSKALKGYSGKLTTTGGSVKL
ncbi:MAG TPA: hypothetical protein VNZ03_25645 [Terriglobales bacterium]|nr:hypothetical protein [Terriglobales bacterium]